MTGLGWHNRGQGFSGVKRLQGLMKDICCNEHEEEAECESPIVAVTTPEGKKGKGKNLSRKRLLDSGTVKVTHHLHLTSNPGWKQEELLANFDEVDGVLQSEKSEVIDCYASSSDESASDRLYNNKNKRTSSSLREDRRKRKCSSSEKGSSVRCSKRNSNISAMSHNLSNLNASAGGNNISSGGDEVISTDLNSIKDDRKGHVPGEKHPANYEASSSISETHSSEQNRNIPQERTKNQWTTSSFQDLNTASKIGETRPSTVKCKNSKDCHNLKPRMVRRRLNIDLDHPGQISDIESDLSDADKTAMSLDDPDITDEDNDDSFTHNNKSPQKKLKGSEGCGSDVEDSQLEIISGTSASSINQSQEKISATDWIQALQKQKTPTKGDEAASWQGDDSAKKKKKYTRGSLSDQLSRLISREKSAIRFWYHSVGAGTFDGKNSKSVTVRLTTLIKQFSVYLSHCVLIGDPGGREDCKVLFSKETVVKLSLKIGMTIQIFATWQQIETNTDDCTLLCTHFIKVLSSETKSERSEEKGNDSSNKLTASAVWSCPCSKDSSIPHARCPASQCPVLPCIPVQDAAHCSYQSPAVMLHSISGFSSQVSSVPGRRRRTLLESIEGTRSDAPCLPSFCATVLRVFQHKVKNSLEIRFQLLLEDPAGTIAVLLVADDFVEKLKSVRKLEGKACVFSGLKVMARINRDKEPMIFAMVDKVWSKRFLNSLNSQSEDDASQYLQLQQAPNFAYKLQPVPNIPFAFDEDKECTNSQNTFDRLELKSIQEALQSELGQRISFIAKVLNSPRLKACYGSGTVFAFDSSCTLGVSTVVCPVKVQDECVLENTLSSICLFKDVLVEEGVLCCDAFTLVVSHPSWELWDIQEKITPSEVDRTAKCQLTLPFVSPDSQPGSLVSVEGFISSVDENSAYTWEECEVCGSDKLATSEEAGEVYCTRCNRKVDSPLVRMKMEVYVQCKSLDTNLDIKVNLTETTIHSILPAEADEEGYDMEAVIQKFIRCPVCLVQHHPLTMNNNTGKEQTIMMLTELDYTA